MGDFPKIELNQKNEKNQKHITTFIFGVGRCEAAHKSENGDCCKNIKRNNNRHYFETNGIGILLVKFLILSIPYRLNN